MTGSSGIPTSGAKPRTSTCDLAAGRVQADHADVEAVERAEVRLERQHGVGVPEPDGDPAGAVVDPLAVHDVAAGRSAVRAAIRSTSASSTGPDRISGGAAEREPLAPPQVHQPDTALLHQLLALRHSARLEPRMRRPQRRVPGERQLAAGREDPQPVVGRRRRSGVAGTSSPTGWSTGRTPPSARRSARRRRAPRRPGCRAADRGLKTLTWRNGSGMPPRIGRVASPVSRRAGR